MGSSILSFSSKTTLKEYRMDPTTPMTRDAQESTYPELAVIETQPARRPFVNP